VEHLSTAATEREGMVVSQQPGSFDFSAEARRVTLEHHVGHAGANEWAGSPDVSTWTACGEMARIFLEEKLAVQPVASAWVIAHLAALSSDVFDTRDKATRELQQAVHGRTQSSLGRSAESFSRRQTSRRGSTQSRQHDSGRQDRTPTPADSTHCCAALAALDHRIEINSESTAANNRG